MNSTELEPDHCSSSSFPTMSSTTHPLRGPSAVYKSLPLRRDRLSTRVLALLPGKKGDQVRCTLKTTVINASTEYEALSYTWGTSPRRRDILVNGRHFAVTENLEEALGALRLPRRVRWIWADAICINQEDLVERAEQVREMGSIFRNASRVLIWLGSWDPESHFLEPFHRYQALAEIDPSNLLIQLQEEPSQGLDKSMVDESMGDPGAVACCS